MRFEGGTPPVVMEILTEAEKKKWRLVVWHGNPVTGEPEGARITGYVRDYGERTDGYSHMPIVYRYKTTDNGIGYVLRSAAIVRIEHSNKATSSTQVLFQAPDVPVEDLLRVELGLREMARRLTTQPNRTEENHERSA